MATLTSYHVKVHDDGWAVEAEGGDRPSAVETRKADAVKRAREIAQNQMPSQVIVHKQDGTVQEEITYGDTASGDGGPARGKVASNAGHVLVSLANDALQLAAEALQLARTLPSQAQRRTRELRDLTAQREELDDRLRRLRESVGERVSEKADEGRSVTERILSDDRVRSVLDQAENARSQIKAAITSLRKTGSEATSSAARAGKEQSEAARSQVKAAATSVRKTAETTVDAGRDAVDS